MQRIILYGTEILLPSDNFANVRHILSSILAKKKKKIFEESLSFKINNYKHEEREAKYS